LDTSREVQQPEQLALFHSGSIDVAKLRSLGEKLQTGPRSAPLTTRGRIADWRMFTEWCERLGRSPLPASADTVWLYITSMLVERKCKTSTATHHLFSIMHYHRAANLPVPPPQKIQGLLADVRRDRHERYEGKRALTPQILARLCAACDGATNTGARDRALLVLGFATSMRRSELSQLDLADVTFESKGVAILLRRSKTDQGGRGRLIAVWPGAKPATDPVELLRAWIKRRGSWAGPLFSRIDGFDQVHHDRIGGEAINKVLKRWLKRIGIDPKPYGAHSLRAGAVTAAAELGRSDQEIMALSGHKNADVMRQYVRRARVFDGRNPLAGVL
jgi:integrase